MKVIAGCITLMVALFAVQQQQLATAAVATGNNNFAPHVGLYAPDRYEGIPEMCLMPMDFGYCRAKVKRYYFDMRRMKCAMFYWGGCAGNINNFKSLDECNKFCIDNNYDYETEDDNVNTRNYINKHSNKNPNTSNNNNSRVNPKSSNNSNNKEVSSNSNIKNSNRRISDNAGSEENKDNIEDDTDSDYNNNN